jgi:hypothetical protein
MLSDEVLVLADQSTNRREQLSHGDLFLAERSGSTGQGVMFDFSWHVFRRAWIRCFF